MGVNLCDLGFDNGFIDVTIKAQATGKRYIRDKNLQTFVLQKITSKYGDGKRADSG